MQLYAFNQGMSHLWLPHKLILIMKLVIIMMITTLTQVYASGFAQKVSLNEKNIPLKSVIEKIRLQTGYDFVFDSRIVNTDARLNLNLQDVRLEDALNQVFGNQNLDFTIRDKVIVLERKAPGFLDRIVSKFNAMDIRGTVYDENGRPLPGASVKIKGSNKSVKTNDAGEFTLTGINYGESIVVSYIGYETYEMEITSKTFMINGGVLVALRLSSGNLNEVTVVNTGYQKLNRLNTTGSAVTIGSKELEKRNAVNILQNLEGVVPGLVQYRNNATIRGVSTIRASQQILVVVDGFPIEGSIAGINPYDVESVSVLKDAAAAAIYGARASNGVIVVTTKKAKVAAKTVIEASMNVTVTDKPDYSYYNFMTPAEQVDWESKYYKWYFDGAGGTVANPVTTFESQIDQGGAATPVQYAYYQLKKSPATFSQSQLDALLSEYRNNNFPQQFKDHALLNQITQQYNLALRTNNGKSQSSLVLNYRTDNGGIINAFNRQVNLFYKGTYAAAGWLDINYGVNSVIGKGRSHNSAYATNPFNMPTYARLLNPDGSKASYTIYRFNQYNTLTETTPALSSLKFNHLDELARDYANTTSLNTRYYVDLNLKATEGLTINPMFQYEDNRSDRSAYSEAESFTMRYLQDVYTSRTGTPGNYVYTNLLPKGGKLNSAQSKSPSYTARVQANYNREFGKHGFIGIGGYELRETRSYGTRGILLGYDDQLQIQSTNNVNFATLRTTNGAPWNPAYPASSFDFPSISDIGLNIDTKHRYASGYANLTYTYDHKYNLFGSARKDYADLFGGDEKYRGKPLWSVGASWIASNESFMKDLKFVDFVKVRGSYGLTGNIDPSNSAILTGSTGTNAETRLPNASVANPPNPQLRWEKTAVTNIGVDFSLFANRLRGTLDVYKRVGTDLFASKRLDPSEGFTDMVINNASMLNRGIEVTLGYDWIKPTQNGLNWSTNLNVYFNKNKITYVDEVTTDPFALAAAGGFKVGDPVRSLYSFRFAGLTPTGIGQFYTPEGLPSTARLTDVKALIFSGGAEPKLNVTLNNDVSYKGFTLSVYAVYYGGHYFRSQSPSAIQQPDSQALPNYLLNSWTPANTNTDVPGSGQYYVTSPNGAQYGFADIYVRRADFIKVRNIVLAYNLPSAIATKVKASSLGLRFQVNNPKPLWTRQKDVHMDPETSGAPQPTSFVFGLNANF